MMKYTPRVRSEIAPMIHAASAETAIAAGQPMKALVTPSATRMLPT